MKDNAFDVTRPPRAEIPKFVHLVMLSVAFSCPSLLFAPISVPIDSVAVFYHLVIDLKFQVGMKFGF